MWGFFHACFNEIIYDEIVKLWKPKVPHFVNRDGLNKRPAPGKPKKSAHGISKPLSTDCNTVSEPLLQKGGGKDIEGRNYGCGVEEKGTIRVKIVMTKQEAARLLSKCKDGGCLEFKDVARELVQIPMNRVSVVSPMPSRYKVLESIPEEI